MVKAVAALDCDAAVCGRRMRVRFADVNDVAQ
jgi:hypothetical protein